MRNTLLITAIDGRFMSENGIVAVLGDKNQFVNSDIRRINASFHPREGVDFKN